MAYKDFQLPELGTVRIYKRRGSKSLRLSVEANGRVRVSIPLWAAYASGIRFAESRRAWIAAHVPLAQAPLAEGQLIGKAHRIRFVARESALRVSTRLHGTEIIITHPVAIAPIHDAAQTAAHAASVRALRLQAEELLPRRLEELATAHGFAYGNVSVRALKSRWGSCDQRKNIVLNLYLMQLPWKLIDYVLLHELTHTLIMRHGPDFWTEMRRVAPNVASLKKEIRDYRPAL